MIRQIGRYRPAAPLGQHCPQVTQKIGNWGPLLISRGAKLACSLTLGEGTSNVANPQPVSQRRNQRGQKLQLKQTTQMPTVSLFQNHSINSE